MYIGRSGVVEKWREDAALRQTGADGQGVGDGLPQLHMVLPVRQEVCDPPAGGVRYIQLGTLVLKKNQDVLKVELKSTNRFLEWVCEGFKVGQYKALKGFHYH